MPTPAQPDKSVIYSGLWLRYRRRSQVSSIGDRFSVERQFDYLEDECERLGITNTKDFVDAQGHRSARHEHTRPDYLRLKEELRTSGAVGVMITEIDRAWRSVKETASFFEWCRDNGKHIIVALDRFNTVEGVTATDLENFYTKAARAQGESDKAKERMERHIRGTKKRGIPWGTPPYGTRMEGQGSQRHSVRREPYDANVPRLMQWFAQGLSYRAVLREARAAGLVYTNKRGDEQPFTLQAVQSIIRNVLFYAGYIVVERKRRKDARILLADGDDNALARYARAHGAVKSDKIVPLIDDVLANSVVERRVVAQRTGRPAEYVWPLLTRILWCRVGDQAIKMRSHRDRYCTVGKHIVSLTHGTLDDIFFENLIALRFNAAAIEYIQGMVIDRTNNDDKARYRATVKRVQAALGRLKELYTDGVIETRQEFDAKFRALQSELGEAQQRLSEPTEVVQRVVEIGDLASTLTQISPQRRRVAVAAMFDRVEINEEGVFVRVIWAEEFRHAFDLVVEACTNYALDRTRDNTLYNAANWFAALRPAA